MSKIEPIENPDRRNEIREIGRRVFQWTDSFEVVFKPEIEACLMFHPRDDPLDVDYLTKEPYEAIIAAAKHVGDTGFVLSDHLNGLMRGTTLRSYIKPPGSEHRIEVPYKDAEDWWCEFPEYEDYRKTGCIGLLDRVLYSINAHWGVYTQYEWWHLVGGNLDFICHVDKMYPAWRNDMITLVDEWEGEMARGHETVDRLVKLLDYWKKWPGDEWVETFTAKLDHKLTGGL